MFSRVRAASEHRAPSCQEVTRTLIIDATGKFTRTVLSTAAAAGDAKGRLNAGDSAVTDEDILGTGDDDELLGLTRQVSAAYNTAKMTTGSALTIARTGEVLSLTALIAFAYQLRQKKQLRPSWPLHVDKPIDPPTGPPPAPPVADPDDLDSNAADSDDTKGVDIMNLANTIAAQLAAELSPNTTLLARGILRALSISQQPTIPGRDDNQLNRFVERVARMVQGSIDLGKHRGDGSLGTGSKEWRQRFVQAHQHFLHQLVPRSARLQHWDDCGRRLTRGTTIARDEDSEAALSYLVVTRCIPVSVQAAITEAYPPQHPSPGEAVVLAAIEADDYSRFDSIALKNIRYLAGK